MLDRARATPSRPVACYLPFKGCKPPFAILHKLQNECPFVVVEYGLCDPPDLIGSVAKFFGSGEIRHIYAPHGPRSRTWAP